MNLIGCLLPLPNNIRDTKKYSLDCGKMLVFDDVINKLGAVQSKRANHYTDEHNIYPIYISRSYYDVPSKTWQNYSHLILYPFTTKRHYDLIRDRY